MRLTILGSSSHVPTSDRDTTSLLVQPAADASPVLVEAPGGVVRKLRALGVDHRRVEHVVVTHDHTDHLYGFPHLVHARLWDRGAVDVHAPPRTVETLRALLAALDLGGELYPDVRFHAVDPDAARDRPFLDHGGLSFTGVRAEHPRPTLAFRVEEAATGHRFVHSADTRPTARITELARGAHTLVHDCGAPHRFAEDVGRYHTTAREAAQVAEEAGVARLVLIHLHASLGFDDAELVAEAQGHYGGEVVVARDGLELGFL